MTRRLDRLFLFIFIALSALASISCAEEAKDNEEAPSQLILTLDTVTALSPVLEGTLLNVKAVGVDSRAMAWTLRVERDAASVTLTSTQIEGDTIRFEVSAELMTALGVGEQTLSFTLIEDDRESTPYSGALVLADALPVDLSEGLDANSFLEDELVLRGAGFLDAGEGSIEAALVGDFTPDGSTQTNAVDARLPVRLADPTDRSRGLLRLTTEINGLVPGRFEGSFTLHSTLRSGAVAASSSQPALLNLTEATIFDVNPASAPLGSVVEVRGGGFIGAPDRTGEATLLHFVGEVEDAEGNRTVFDQERTGRWLSGHVLALDLEPEVMGEALVSKFFGVQRGRFEGDVTPSTLRGAQEQAGISASVSLVIEGPRQVVLVDFLPGFFSSLDRFGLTVAADDIREKTIARMQSIFEGYAVEFVIELPTNVIPSAVTVVEIGGPDPNGLGMFGYDNTPGKDFGNLRMFDRIGGANAETQADGYPGYGGVFIESILFWSSHPGLDAPLLSGPDADPLFDDIFDPVRSNPATLEALRGDGDPARAAEVQRAVSALASIVGETAAHEFGHSLGLSQPYGPDDAYHTLVPGDGCLMDRGSDRPLGERAAQPGFAATKFCGEEAEYLQEILAQ